MERWRVCSVAAALVFGAASALAQAADLSGVTMRVLDDLSDVDAVLLELDANRGEGEEGAESDGRVDRDAAANDDDGRDAAPVEADEDELRDRDELHEDDDDRSEGRREDRDVERPAATLPAIP
jgi:hypothetical protein